MGHDSCVRTEPPRGKSRVHTCCYFFQRISTYNTDSNSDSFCSHLVSVSIYKRLRSVLNTGLCCPGQCWLLSVSTRPLGSKPRYSVQILICFTYIFQFSIHLWGWLGTLQNYHFEPESRLISGVLELGQVRLFWKINQVNNLTAVRQLSVQNLSLKVFFMQLGMKISPDWQHGFFKYQGGCFTNVSRALQNSPAKIHNTRNHIYGENFKLKLCTCAQSHALGTRTKFQLEILIRTTIRAIHKFQENIGEFAKR